MSKFVNWAAAAAVAVGLSFGVPTEPANATTLDFWQITSNGNEDLTGQLFVDVTDAGNDQVSFNFRNEVGIASVISEIYFADGTLLGIAEVNNHPDVSFSQGANPGDLPGGGSISPKFETTAGFLASADNPAPHNGVRAAGQFVEIIFDLINGKSFADTILALISGELRIGLHVTSIGALGGSESYVNNPPPAIPLPAGLVLFLSGLAGIGVLGRYKAMRPEQAIN